jgi:hypothetical protein
MNAKDGPARGACHATTAYLAEKPSLTNRIGRHFARIKAAPGCGHLIVVTAAKCLGKLRRRSKTAAATPSEQQLLMKISGPGMVNEKVARANQRTHRFDRHRPVYTRHLSGGSPSLAEQCEAYWTP